MHVQVEDIDRTPEQAGQLQGELADRERAELDRLARRKAALLTEDDTDRRTFGSAWPWSADPDHYQNRANPEFHRQREAFLGKCSKRRDELQSIETQLDLLPRQYAAVRSLVRTSVVLGPRIEVPALPALPREEGDRQLEGRLRERAAAMLVEAQAAEDVATVETAAREAATRLETVRNHHRLDLATADDVEAAERVSREAGTALGRLEAKRTDNAKRFTQINEAIAARRAVIEREHDAQVTKLRRQAAIDAATALIEAMARMTYLRRLLREEPNSDLWHMKALNADVADSEGRRWLEGLIERGLWSRGR